MTQPRGFERFWNSVNIQKNDAMCGRASSGKLWGPARGGCISAAKGVASQEGYHCISTDTSDDFSLLCAATQLKAFEVVCRQMLEDVQERLVYRTHIYIKSDILNYKPASGDLAYPEKLQMMKVRALISAYFFSFKQ